MSKLSPAQIGQQIEALDATLADLQERATELALAAVEADPTAVKELEAVRAEMALVAADRSVLVAAKRAAQGREAAQHEALKAQERAAHMADAQRHAAALLASARRIDDLIDAYGTEIAALIEAQTAVRASWRAAGEPLNDARLGRANAQAHAAFLMQAVLDGSSGARQDKTLTAFVATGWAELLGKNHA
jgi:hypothetical protein